MGGVFVCYRRGSTFDITHRICDWLKRHLHPEEIIVDIDSVPPGVDFRKELERHLCACKVVLVIVGKDWAHIADRPGQPRIMAPGDYVRVEIELALSRRVPIIPVRVHGASMPQPTELPEEIAEFAYRNALIISDHSFKADVGRLIGDLRLLLSDRPPRPSSRTTRPLALEPAPERRPSSISQTRATRKFLLYKDVKRSDYFLWPEVLRPELHDQLSRTLSWSIGQRATALNAINELVENAFKHGCGKNGAKCVAICIEVVAESLVATITDEGNGFDLEQVLAAAVARTQAQKHLGLPFVKSCACDLVTEDGGRCIRAVFRAVPAGKSGLLAPVIVPHAMEACENLAASPQSPALDARSQPLNDAELAAILAGVSETDLHKPVRIIECGHKVYASLYRAAQVDILRIHHEISYDVVGEIEQKIRAALFGQSSSRRCIAVELSAVPFMSSSAMGAVFAISNEAQRLGIACVFLNIVPQVLSMWRQIGMADMLRTSTYPLSFPGSVSRQRTR